MQPVSGAIQQSAHLNTFPEAHHQASTLAEQSTLFDNRFEEQGNSRRVEATDLRPPRSTSTLLRGPPLPRRDAGHSTIRRKRYIDSDEEEEEELRYKKAQREHTRTRPRQPLSPVRSDKAEMPKYLPVTSKYPHGNTSSKITPQEAYAQVARRGGKTPTDVDAIRGDDNDNSEEAWESRTYKAGLILPAPAPLETESRLQKDVYTAPAAYKLLKGNGASHTLRITVQEPKRPQNSDDKRGRQRHDMLPLSAFTTVDGVRQDRSLGSEPPRLTIPPKTQPARSFSPLPGSADQEDVAFGHRDHVKAERGDRTGLNPQANNVHRPPVSSVILPGLSPHRRVS